MIMATADTPFMDAPPVNGAIGLVVGATGETPPVEATPVGVATPVAGGGGGGAEVVHAYSVTVTVWAEAPTAMTAATTAKILNCILTVGRLFGVFGCLKGEDVGGGVERVKGLK